MKLRRQDLKFGVVASGKAAKIYKRGKLIDSLVPFNEVIDRMTRMIETFERD